MESYEEIVNKWYLKLQKDFINSMMTRYANSKLKKEDAENIYQDVFIAIKENYTLGKIKDNTSWRNYIWRIGMNMASKQYRGLENIEKFDNGFDLTGDFKEYEKITKYLDYADNSGYSDEMVDIVNDEMAKMTPAQRELMVSHYVYDMKDSEIANEEEFEYKSTDSVKVVRNRYFRQFRDRVRERCEQEGLWAS